MSRPPPLPPPDLQPPPLPRPPPLPQQTRNEKTPEDYLKRASILCFVFSGLIGIGTLLILGENFMEGKRDPTKIAIASSYAVLSALAGFMLHRRKRFGDVLAIICFVCWLPGFPVGTVLACLGISWVRKSHALLH